MACAQGCVQEEIRFMVCPELMLGQLFCEVMDANEVRGLHALYMPA
jgi:hypothetical protein